MQKEIVLVKVKSKTNPKAPKLGSAMQLCCSSCLSGTTWTIAWEQMSLSDSSQKASPVPAFTSQPGRWRWARSTFCFVRSFSGSRTPSVSSPPFQIPLPNRPHWFLLFGATEEEIQEICLKILQLYTRKKVCFLFISWVFVKGCSLKQALENLIPSETGHGPRALSGAGQCLGPCSLIFLIALSE